MILYCSVEQVQCSLAAGNIMFDLQIKDWGGELDLRVGRLASCARDRDPCLSLIWHLVVSCGLTVNPTANWSFSSDNTKIIYLWITFRLNYWLTHVPVNRGKMYLVILRTFFSSSVKQARLHWKNYSCIEKRQLKNWSWIFLWQKSPLLCEWGVGKPEIHYARNSGPGCSC